MSNAAVVSIVVAVIAGQLAAIWYIASTLGARITDLGTVVGRLDTRIAGLEDKTSTLIADVAVIRSKLDQHDAEIRDLRRGGQS